MRCPKCSGFLYTDPAEDQHCLNCGFYLFHVVAPPINTDAYRWQSVLCGKCHTLSAIRGRELCRPCYAKMRERQAAR